MPRDDNDSSVTATVTEFQPIDPEHLKLPECPIPRPGDKVCWYAGSKYVHLGSGVKTRFQG
jgi:hypothetical protein